MIEGYCMNKNIILIGYRGSGKTTVGKFLADKIKYEFADTDEYIEKNQKISIPEIVDRYGWNYFRNIETKITKSISLNNNMVVSTGGGIILRQENMDNLKKNGWTVYLRTTPLKIYDRIKDSQNRPSLTGNKSFLDEIYEVLKEREHLYEKYADYIIDTDDYNITELSEVLKDEYKRI